MRAAIYWGAGDIRIEDVPMPTAGQGDLLIEVAANGICGTDAHEYVSGPHMYPGGGFVPGHEFAGRVVSVGSGVSGFKEGDLVACGAGVSCGNCTWCLSGRTNLCEKYSTLGLQIPGGLAQFVAAPAEVCLEVGTIGLSSDVAALTQPMSIAVHAMRRGRAETGDRVVVLGAGGIGVFLTYALVDAGANVHVIERDARRRELALSLGASLAVEPGASPGGDVEQGGSDVPTVIYEVTGTESGLALAWGLAVPGTRVVLVGLQDGPSELEMRRLSLNEIELIGTNAHSFASDFSDAARLLASRSNGWGDVAPTVLPLSELVESGLKPMVDGSPTAVKTLIDPRIDEPRHTV